MLIMQYFHDDELLIIGGDHYKVTCRVRNEINRKRDKSEIVETWPDDGKRLPYYPRKIPTGLWEVGTPIYTDNPEYAPVKIPTTAERNVMTWDVLAGQYENHSGIIQQDKYYHLHYSKNSLTTLGCLRIDSEEDALEIAGIVEDHRKVYIEVFASRGEW